MDHRQTPRFAVNQPVSLVVLTGQEHELTGHVVNISQSGLRLLVRQPVAAGAAVKVEYEDTLLLGEAVYCYPAGDQFAVGLALEQALYGTGELAILADRLLGECRNATRAPAN